MRRPSLHKTFRRDNPRSRRGRIAVILLVSAASFALAVAGMAGGGYLYVNSYFSSIHRISGITALTAADQPRMPAATRRSLTILMLDADVLPPYRHGHGKLGSSRHAEQMSGLIALLHFNANRRGASLTAIPPDAVVHIPGHGRKELWDALPIGGPSLLITTVMRLTRIRIDHFAVVDFADLKSVISAIHGVNVQVTTPFTSDGYHFHAGRDHLGPDRALAYARDTSVSEIGRGWLQESLIRAFADKAAGLGPMATLHVARAVTKALSLDSNFTNTELAALTFQLRDLHGSQTLWIDAPTTNGSPVNGGTGPVRLNHKITKHLWYAIRHDRVAAFARRYPSTLTPDAPF